MFVISCKKYIDLSVWFPGQEKFWTIFKKSAEMRCVFSVKQIFGMLRNIK